VTSAFCASVIPSSSALIMTPTIRSESSITPLPEAPLSMPEGFEKSPVSRCPDCWMASGMPSRQSYAPHPLPRGAGHLKHREVSRCHGVLFC
jgi:hypothetical protein